MGAAENDTAAGGGAQAPRSCVRRHGCLDAGRCSAEERCCAAEIIAEDEAPALAVLDAPAPPAPGVTAGLWRPHPNLAPDGANAATVLASVRQCAASWDGNARILGNVRASDVVRAIDEMEGRPPVPAAAPGAEEARLRPGLEEALRLVREMNATGVTSLDIEGELAATVDRLARPAGGAGAAATHGWGFGTEPDPIFGLEPEAAFRAFAAAENLAGERSEARAGAEEMATLAVDAYNKEIALRRAIRAEMDRAGSGAAVPVAWMKYWAEDGQERSRVDLREASEPWLDALKPTVVPLYADPGAAPPGLAGAVRDEAVFLLDRLAELGDDAFTEDGARNYQGHVAPSAARLRAALARGGAPGEGWRPSEEDLTIVARSIGRTVRVPDHGRRAHDVFRSLRERDLSMPPSPSKPAPPASDRGGDHG